MDTGYSITLCQYYVIFKPVGVILINFFEILQPMTTKWPQNCYRIIELIGLLLFCATISVLLLRISVNKWVEWMTKWEIWFFVLSQYKKLWWDLDDQYQCFLWVALFKLLELTHPMGYWPVWLSVVPSHSSRFSNFAELHSDCHYFHCEYLILLSSLIFVVWSGIISGILSFSLRCLCHVCLRNPVLFTVLVHFI